MQTLRLRGLKAIELGFGSPGSIELGHFGVGEFVGSIDDVRLLDGVIESVVKDFVGSIEGLATNGLDVMAAGIESQVDEGTERALLGTACTEVGHLHASLSRMPL